eukprot:3612733-Pleurochrysis_carterae.AAC.4
MHFKGGRFARFFVLGCVCITWFDLHAPCRRCGDSSDNSSAERVACSRRRTRCARARPDEILNSAKGREAQR